MLEWNESVDNERNEVNYTKEQERERKITKIFLVEHKLT